MARSSRGSVSPEGASDRSGGREPHPRSGGRVRRPIVWTALIVVTVVLVIGFAAAGARPHEGGDPGNRVYAQLMKIVHAAPVGATDVHLEADRPTRWQGVCPTYPGSRAGWTEVYVSMVFHDTASRTRIIDQFSGAMQHEGWTRHDQVTRPGAGKVAHWVLDVHAGHRAQSFAFRTSGEPDRWFVSASWIPPGAAGGCS